MSDMIIHNMNTVFKYLCIPALITLPVASAYADDDTDSLTNKLISRTRANLSKGDLTTYQHPDRNLVITWTDNSRGDGSPIRDADVSAKKYYYKF